MDRRTGVRQTPHPCASQLLPSAGPAALLRSAGCSFTLEGGGRQQRAKTPAAPQRCFQAAARLLLAHLCPSREGGEGGARLCSVPSADSEAGGRRMEPGPPGGCPRMKDRRRGRGGGRRGIFHRAQPPVRRFSPDTPAPPPRASSPRERSHMLSGCHRGDRSADKETGGLGGGGWGGGARCEAVGAASSPAETLGWRMGTTQRPHGGRVMGRGASSPCLSTPPPPQKSSTFSVTSMPAAGPRFALGGRAGLEKGKGGKGGWDSLPVPNGQPCPQHAAMGTMAAGHPDTAPPAPRHLPAPPRRGAARGQPAPGPWHGGTPDPCPPHCVRADDGDGGPGERCPPPKTRGAPSRCCAVEGLHSCSGENESARKVSAAPGPSPHGALWEPGRDPNGRASPHPPVPKGSLGAP